MTTFSLSLFEIAAVAGLFQCVMIIVYFYFRAGNFALAVSPLAFFMFLAVAFYADLASRFLETNFIELRDIQFWCWMFVCPLSVLFVLQFSDFSKPIPVGYYLILLLIPIAAISTEVLEHSFPMEGCSPEKPCPDPGRWALLMGFLGGTLSLPFLWLKENLLKDVRSQPSGTERYWMILSLLGLNFVLLSLIFMALTQNISLVHFAAARNVIGLVFVYISATCLFRIYPAPASIITTKRREDHVLGEEDQQILEKIKNKLELEKVYLESSYSRSDLARELEMPESTISRLINAHYQKSFPVLLNEYRVEEACQLLKETDAPINIISTEVGFNSLASFNRVFKDLTGQTATSYRKDKEAA